MQLACPKCGHRDARVSTPKGLVEGLKSLAGATQLRCRRCNERWETSVWADKAWKFARCPRCYRQELTTWSLAYYQPPTSTHLMITMGATPYRCAACRCNFASFKPCRSKFVWRHQTRVEATPVAETNGADLQALSDAVGSKTVKPETAPQDSTVSR